MKKSYHSIVGPRRLTSEVRRTSLRPTPEPDPVVAMPRSFVGRHAGRHGRGAQDVTWTPQRVARHALSVAVPTVPGRSDRDTLCVLCRALLEEVDELADRLTARI